MTHHLEVVTPVETVHPAIYGFTVAFLTLGGVILGAGIGTFALPTEFRVAPDGLALFKLEKFLIRHVYPPKNI
jgi:hypothetical protein